MAQIPLVEMRGITKRFGGVLAVDNVSIDLQPGEVVGLLGLGLRAVDGWRRQDGVLQLEERGRQAEALADGEAAGDVVAVVPEQVQPRRGDAAVDVVVVVAQAGVELQLLVEEGPVGLQEDTRRAVDVGVGIGALDTEGRRRRVLAD